MPFKDQLVANAYFRARYRRVAWERKTQAIESMGGRCVDCGFDDLSRLEVFDFDHLPGKLKKINLSRIFASYSLERVLEELAQCEVVCSNCHRTRTKKRTCSMV